MVFKKLLKEINDKEDFVNWISAEEESEKIQRTMINEAKTEGIEQGQQELKIEIAKNMLNKNIDIKTISEITGLTTKVIGDLK